MYDLMFTFDNISGDKARWNPRLNLCEWMLDFELMAKNPESGICYLNADSGFWIQDSMFSNILRKYEILNIAQ